MGDAGAHPPTTDKDEDSQLPQSQALALALTYELEEYAEDLAAQMPCTWRCISMVTLWGRLLPHCF